LDEDDDGDLVLTRNEDLNYCDDPENPALNPGNDLSPDGLTPLYLNNQQTGSVNINVYRANRISRTFLTLVVFNDITFQSVNSDESLTFQNFPMGRFETTIQQTINFTDGSISEDEAGNICQ
jgi:hypothetical protein